MDNFEKVEKLRERANVTYEEAKEALENSNWDILDAMIYLEKHGKTPSPDQSSYSTQNKKPTVEYEEQTESKSSFTDILKRFGQWCLKILEKGNRNSFCVEKGGKELFRVPVTLLVALLLFAFWVVLPLLVVGLFFSMKYHFVGPDMHTVDFDINKAMDGAAQTAENIKNEFNDAAAKDEK